MKFKESLKKFKEEMKKEYSGVGGVSGIRKPYKRSKLDKALGKYKYSLDKSLGYQKMKGGKK